MPLHLSSLSPSPLSTCNSTSALGLGSFPPGAAVKTRQADSRSACQSAGRACVVAPGGAAELARLGSCRADLRAGIRSGSCGLEGRTAAAGTLRGAAEGIKEKAWTDERETELYFLASSAAPEGPCRFSRWRGVSGARCAARRPPTSGCACAQSGQYVVWAGVSYILYLCWLFAQEAGERHYECLHEVRHFVNFYFPLS